jgi:hypothetical protein
MKMQKALTQAQLAKRWHCSIRNVFRDIKKYQLVPFDYMGKTPLFSPLDVERMERRRIESKNARHGWGAAIRRAA